MAFWGENNILIKNYRLPRISNWTLMKTILSLTLFFLGMKARLNSAQLGQNFHFIWQWKLYFKLHCSLILISDFIGKIFS